MGTCGFLALEIEGREIEARAFSNFREIFLDKQMILAYESILSINQTTEDWYTTHVILSVAKCPSVVWCDLESCSPYSSVSVLVEKACQPHGVNSRSTGEPFTPARLSFSSLYRLIICPEPYLFISFRIFFVWDRNCCPSTGPVGLEGLPPLSSSF